MKRELVSLKPCSHPRYSFRVTFRQGEDYEQKYFKTKADAKAFTDDKKIELLNKGREHGEITNDERQAVILGRKLADDYGSKGVRGFTLEAALKFYAKHLDARGTSARMLAAFDEFYAAKERDKVSAVHLRDFKYRLEPFARKFATRLACDFDTKDLNRWLEALKCAPASRGNHRRLLHNLFEYCRRRGWCEKNPVTDASKLKPEVEAPGILTPAQAAALLAACPAEIVPAVAIGLFAGLRTAEIARLDWSEVNLARGFIEVTAKKSKTAARRLVTITDNLRAWLLPHAKTSGPVRLTEERMKIRFNAARLAAGITEWPNNAARHSFASYHLALHESADKTALQIGHTKTDVLFQHYRELVTPEDAAAYFAITPSDGIQREVAA